MKMRLLEAAIKTAWPESSLDALLRAVTLSDMNAATAAWQWYESRADFDHLTWGEFRLISLAAKRMGQLAPHSPFRQRIAGIERSIWSRSQLAIAQAGPGLRALEAAGIEMLVIKGAGRVASRDKAARGRAVNDIDICVKPGDMAPAFDLLTQAGWTPAGSGTVLYHRQQLGDAVGINLVLGEFGNLDLHRTAFHAPYNRTEADEAIWSRALPASLGGVAVRIPSPTDTVAIAIAHGALDAHKSSDWMVDSAAAIDMGVDWPLLESIIVTRNMAAASVVALSYLHQRLDRHIPADIFERLLCRAGHRPFDLAASIAECRPKSSGLGFFWLARALAKQSRLLSLFRKTRKRRRLVLPTLLPASKHQSLAPKSLKQKLNLPDRSSNGIWSGEMDLTLMVDLPAASRRIDFEINMNDRHLVRLRAFVLNRGPRQRRFRFRLPLSVPAGESDVYISAVPSKNFNTKVPPHILDHYRPLDFQLVCCNSKKH